ncbi:MAG TPA: hypothetical protein VNX02_03695, partial [Steroidobacteraceae bacterium]|nr:hypothetical protein [Steroidobacteraceae bacterium]
AVAMRYGDLNAGDGVGGDRRGDGPTVRSIAVLCDGSAESDGRRGYVLQRVISRGKTIGVRVGTVRRRADEDVLRGEP